MKTNADKFNALAIVLCAASTTVAAATHGSIVARVCCVISALLAIIGIVWKLKEGAKADV